jgi:hypothetical protein
VDWEIPVGVIASVSITGAFRFLVPEKSEGRGLRSFHQRFCAHRGKEISAEEHQMLD